MNTIRELFTDFSLKLQPLYEKEEAEQIAVMIFEEVFNFKRIDIAIQKDKIAEHDSINRLQSFLEELQTGKPIQYVLGYAWFDGWKFKVNDSVLIPRKETEQLVDWIFSDLSNSNKLKPVILDVCSGSGCIAISLKKKFPESIVVGIDDSDVALKTSIENAANLNADVEFRKMNVLVSHPDITADIIVSNPPYVRVSERKIMPANVVDHEPHHALFVPDNDPLVFYRAISEWAYNILSPGGSIYFEANEALAFQISELTSRFGFINTAVRKDFQQKDRMIKAVKPSDEIIND